MLTYVLLRGMRAPGLRPVTARVPALEELLHADQDTNGVVTTWELYDYAERVLPDLAGVYPQLAQRSGGVSLAPVPAAPQALRLQAAESSFPLIEPPADPPGVAGARLHRPLSHRRAGWGSMIANLPSSFSGMKHSAYCCRPVRPSTSSRTTARKSFRL